MGNYYFLSSVLPPAEIGLPVDLSVAGLMHLFEENLSPEDLEQVKTVRRLYDILNIREFWRGQPLDPLGAMGETELEEALLTGMGLPDYVNDFLGRYESQEDRLHYFPGLVAAYFQEELPKAQGFLSQYLAFEREWRLVILGFRAKRLGREVTAELQWEDAYDEVVAQILAQKDAKQYEPPSAYEDVKALFENYGDSPLELHQALCEYRYGKIDALYEGELFSMDRILGYFAQYILAMKWQDLEQQKGSEIVETILKGAS